MPLALLGVLAIVLLPLPTLLVDLLLCFNLVLSMVILLATVYLTRPLEFSVFPSLLLLVTFFRLALNVATTRLILSNAGTQGLGAAGGVVRAFGEFVSGGTPLVGFVIFCLLVIIQFVVITRGATRISEVAARFSLDGLPGKQMSIDSDLGAGLIGYEQARALRVGLSQEVDFYGAMDGASRWIRGDAIAALVITLVNILGGLVTGLLYYRMSPAQALSIYTRLTIGDGLVTQIPAVIIATAAGLLISRSSSPSKLSHSLARQLILQPRLLAAAAACLLLLSLLPVPKLPVYMLAVAAAVGAWFTYRHPAVRTHTGPEDTLVREDSRTSLEQAPVHKPPRDGEHPQAPEVYPLELEIGYQLVGLVEPDSGDGVASRLSRIRQQLAKKLGFAIPTARIRDNLKLGADELRIKLRGVAISRARLPRDKILVANLKADPDEFRAAPCNLSGVPEESYWTDAREQEALELAGLQILTPVEVLERHLGYLLQQRAHQLLTRAEVSRLLEKLRIQSPSLVEEVVPALLSLGELQRVLKGLLEEGIPIYDLETILETLSEAAHETKDTQVLTEMVRTRLGDLISSLYATSDRRLYVLTLEPSLEDLLNGAITLTEVGRTLVLPPPSASALLEAIANRLASAASPAEAQVVILCSSHIRRPLRKLLEKTLPELGVLGYNEIAPTTEVESVGMVTLPAGEELDELSRQVAALAHWPESAVAAVEPGGLMRNLKAGGN